MTRIPCYAAEKLLMLFSLLMTGCMSPGGDPFENKAEWAAGSFDAPVITKAELQEKLRNPEGSQVLLVDTRAAGEYAVSHLPGAILWDPYKESALPVAIADHARAGKPVVFYCSIGYRSGYATESACQLLGSKAGDGISVFNLRGGIFQWANEGGPVEGGSLVHPYDQQWGELLRADLRAPLSEQ
jgi:rhodanese-related sulfurtransferase